MGEIGLSGDAMSPVALFLQADIIVKSVMIGLLAASVWTWTIIVGQWMKLRRTVAESERFERDFWKSEDIDAFYELRGREEQPAAKVLAAGLAEWRRSTAGRSVDREGTRSRLAVALHSAVAAETDRLAGRLNILATVGSVAPFVGLFGTVWGIMRSFSDIAGQQSTSLAVVAPGIAEALFATALGLFAAIPAVIAYNRFSYGINRIEARLQRFADGFHATLSRELAAEGGMVAVAWDIDAEQQSVLIRWTESGGPPVAPPTTSGFGRLLLERALASTLHGCCDRKEEPAHRDARSALLRAVMDEGGHQRSAVRRVGFRCRARWETRRRPLQRCVRPPAPQPAHPDRRRRLALR